jgi:hypothetical protein
MLFCPGSTFGQSGPYDLPAAYGGAIWNRRHRSIVGRAYPALMLQKHHPHFSCRQSFETDILVGRVGFAGHVLQMGPVSDNRESN